MSNKLPKLRNKYLQSDLDDIISKHWHRPISEIQNLYPEINIQAIRRRAKKLGISRSEFALKRFSYNENYFQVPTVENCYWASFIAADGNICDKWKTKKIQIAISDKDRSHLYQFKEDIKYTGNIYTAKNSKTRIDGSNIQQVSIAIASNKLCMDLEKWFNILPRKTHTLQPPNLIQKDLIFAYIKGYIDGDGCIGTYNIFGRDTTRITIAGNLTILEWIKEQLQQHIPHLTLKNNISKNSRCETRNLYLNGYKAELVIKELASLNTRYLGRKWEKYL